MNAVPLPNFAPGSPEWMKRMTASKVAAVLGLSPWESRFSLWHRMAGLIEQPEMNDQMRRGHYLEAAVAEWWHDQHPEFEMGAGHAWENEERPWQAASPDRLLWRVGSDYSEFAGVLEVKTTAEADEWGAAGTDEIPPYYRAQVVWQLDTLGLDVSYVAVLLPRLEFREYRISYNADEAAYIREEARAFLDSLPGGPAEQRPDIDSDTATYAAIKALNPSIEDRDAEVPLELAREFCDAVRALKDAEKREAKARAELADLMGTAKKAVYVMDDKTRVKLADRRGRNPYMQAVSADRLPAIPAEIPDRFSVHTWQGGEDEECLVCGVSWSDADLTCQSTTEETSAA